MFGCAHSLMGHLSDGAFTTSSSPRIGTSRIEPEDTSVCNVTFLVEIRLGIWVTRLRGNCGPSEPCAQPANGDSILARFLGAIVKVSA